MVERQRLAQLAMGPSGRVGDAGAGAREEQR